MSDAGRGREMIAVIGGGLIGTSWSALFLPEGYEVALHEAVIADRDNVAVGIDAAQMICLCWSVVGSQMAYHRRAIAHYLSHLEHSQKCRWQDLGLPRLDPAKGRRV